MPQPIYIAGEWRAGRGRLIRSMNPAEGTVNAEVAGASAADVDDAVERAEEAWRTQAWRELKPHLRAAVLHRISNAISAQSEALALLQSQRTASPCRDPSTGGERSRYLPLLRGGGRDLGR